MNNTDTQKSTASAIDIEAIVLQMVSDGKKEGKNMFDVLREVQLKLKEMGVVVPHPLEQINPLELHQEKIKMLQEQIGGTEDSVEKARLQKELVTAKKILKLEIQVIRTAKHYIALNEGIIQENLKSMPP